MEGLRNWRREQVTILELFPGNIFARHPREPSVFGSEQKRQESRSRGRRIAMANGPRTESHMIHSDGEVVHGPQLTSRSDPGSGVI